jgi:hypothetical protein
MTEVATELSKNVKVMYHQWLHTDDAKESLRVAIAMKREWRQLQNNTDVTYNTENVKLTKIDPRINSKMTKIEIITIGLNNMCHETAELVRKELGLKKRLGYTVTACPCGRRYSMELHSVNQHNGTLYDFTRDFADETSKWFYEIGSDTTIHTHIAMFGNTNYTVNNGCKCNITWLVDDCAKVIDENKLIGLLDTMRRVRVW